MNEPIKCFWIEPTHFFVRELRRYSPLVCKGKHGHHNASVKIDILHRPHGVSEHDVIEHIDARWPKHCHDCDYVFPDSDPWQVNDHQLYRHPESDRMFDLRQAPAGAMWDATWFGETWKGPDGKHLVVMLPDGTEWMIDGPDSNGVCAWKRNGIPPLITARPSIKTLKYHGYLTDGVLKLC